MSDLDSTINDLRQKIRLEQKVHEAAKNMRAQLRNRNALEECDTTLRESEKRIDFLQQQLHRMQLKKENRMGAEGSKEDGRDRSSSFSNLDLRKSDSALSTQKVSLKLHELAYKLDVERKLKEGSDRIASIYRRDGSRGDRRKIAHADAAGSALNEATDKIKLLERALKKYQSLYVEGLDDEEDSAGGDATANVYRLAPGMRRPMTGKLKLKVMSASHLSHAPLRGSKISETFATIKIDGTVKCSTRPNRNTRWYEEFELHVHKASELEISIYDRTDRNVLIGMWWVKFSDLYEDVRKRQVVRPNQGDQAWASATQLQEGEENQAYTGTATGGQMVNMPGSGASGQEPSLGQVLRAYNGGGIQCLWDVEPIGQLELWLDFVKEAKPQRQPTRLGRKAAVRKRRGDPVVVQGHRFYPKPFYTIMKCAMCEEYLVNSVGYQCDDCNLFCHEKCHSKVVTKCISKSDSEIDRDEDKINHRIPHRFEPSTVLSANWCSHCGYMLSLGRKDNRKCSECNMLCHQSCSLMVPHFCGMKMIVANQILNELKRRSMVLPPTSAGTSTTSPSSKPSSTSSGGDSKFSSYVAAPTNYLNSSQLPSLSSLSIDSGFNPSPAGTPPQPSAPGANSGYMVGQGFSTPQQFNQPYPIPHSGGGGYAKPLPQPVPHVPGTPVGQQVVTKPSAPIVPDRKVCLQDFNLLAVLGKGNFGKVMLAEERTTRNLYAIKVLKKEFIVQNDEFESMRSEKRVFQVANQERHPFLIGLHSCFQSDTRLYFVMEYISGGDLMWHIQRQTFSERRAKFYAAEVLLALEYFHRHNIIYRDLKLDNILLAADGHIKLVDYGLCKEHMGYGATTNTFCGTPEFMAPEILMEQRYGRAVDWWAFGVLIYEMLLGQPPFRGDTEDEIFDSILDEEVLYPINMSRDSVSILQRLLTREPARRLGSGPSDAEEIRRHPFFKSINWDDIFHKRVTPPYIPQLRSRVDVSNFDEEFTRERPALTPTNTFLKEDQQEEFMSFSYVAEWAAAYKDH
ncbi:Serine/threonine kinase [Dispira simplex]|nr:Serine/threonine kinase [Dispira simplex]